MRVHSRFLAVVFAVAMSAALVPTAVADGPPPEPPMVYCPDIARVSTIVGTTVSLSGVTRASCSYSAPSFGTVSFDFYHSAAPASLTSLRASEVESGTPVVDVPALGPGAFSYESTDDLNLRWFGVKPTDHLFYLSVPLTHQDVALPMADLLVAAIAPSPAPTVPAKDFTMKCPSAAQVTKVIGRKVDFAPRDSAECLFKDGEKSISFSIVPGYGSITEYRARKVRDLTVSGAPPVPVMDFGGLTPGAFVWADLSPVTLTWQLEGDVLAQLWALEDTDVLRRLAVLFTDVQKGSGSPTTPAKPGLPSTGD